MIETKMEYYKNASEKHLTELLEFRKQFKIISKIWNNIPVEYIKAGHGNKTILIFHGAMGNAESSYKRILQLKSEYSVIAPSIKDFKNLEEFYKAIDYILTNEKVTNLYIYGGSFGGIIAQAYFYYCIISGRVVKGLVINSTFPPLPEWAWYFKIMISILKLIPSSALTKFMSGKLLKLTKVDIKLSPAQQEYLEFYISFFKEISENKVSKNDIICQVKLVADVMKKIKISPEILNKWGGKILIVTSKTDPNFKYHERLKSQFLNSKELVFENTGHLGVLIKEKEFMESLFNFLL